MTVSISNNYSHKHLINNPPHITNHPVEEYLSNNKDNFLDNELDMYYQVKGEEDKKVNFMGTLYYGTLAACGGALALSYKKIKHLFKK